MSKDINKVILIGNLGREPELRKTVSGVDVVNFSVATNKEWKDANGEKKEKTEFHNVVVWGKLAEICAKLLSKGSKVYIEGQLQTKEWEDKDGIKRYKTEIVADNMVLLGGGKKNDYSQPEPTDDFSQPEF